MSLYLWGTLMFLSFSFKHMISQDPNTDAFYLSSFFTAMGSTKEQALSSSSLCSWPGVVCDSKGEYVIHFSASMLGLSGSIPDNTIGKMRMLRSLDLSGNKIKSLPSDFWSLGSLESLNLSSNMISEPLPSNIGNFMSLQSLDLSFNGFSGEIPASISSLVGLTTLKLGNNGFQFGVPPGLLHCRSLVSVDLSSNRLSGSLPVGFGSAFPELESLNLSRNLFQGSLMGVLHENIVTVDLRDNQFEGHILELIAGNKHNWSSLVYLDLSENRFVGHILNGLSSSQKLRHLNLACNRFRPQEFPKITKLPALYYLNLSRTNLAGIIPGEISQLSHLKVLDLSSNNLTGHVPLLRFKNIDILDLSKNKLEGKIPKAVLDKLPMMQRFNFSFNNLTFCNPNFSQGMIQASFFGSTNNCPFAAKPILLKRKKLNKKKTGLKIGLALAISMAFLLVGLFLILFALRDRRRSRTWAAKQATELNLSDQSEPTDIPVVMIDKPLMKMTFADLRDATLNFDRGTLLWEGKSGPTYEAVLPGGFRAALKVIPSGTTLTDQEAAIAFERLARINHPNLVPVSGYCITAEQRIAIYEHLDNAKLQCLLHNTDNNNNNNNNSETMLTSWRLRHKIALGTARALAFLHHGCIPPVVHGEVKAATICLDSSHEPQLAEFGLAKLLDGGFNGSLDGYTPPDHDQHGYPTAESDVYSFGIVLLELVSGKKPELELVDWVRGLVRRGEASLAIDPAMRESATAAEEISEAVKIGYLCTADLPWKRPTMQQVVGLLKDISPVSS
ncbi:unnamed protein product [Cochlearia groenlandica]